MVCIVVVFLLILLSFIFIVCHAVESCAKWCIETQSLGISKNVHEQKIECYYMDFYYAGIASNKKKKKICNERIWYRTYTYTMLSLHKPIYRISVPISMNERMKIKIKKNCKKISNLCESKESTNKHTFTYVYYVLGIFGVIVSTYKCTGNGKISFIVQHLKKNAHVHRSISFNLQTLK